VGESVVVLGGGSWGTTLASIAASRCPTILWVRSPELADEINLLHTNDRYLPGIQLPDTLSATVDLAACLEQAAIVLVAVPSHGVRSVLGDAAAAIAPGTPVFSLAKGIEDGTSLRMSEVITSIAPQVVVGAVSGPNLAHEIAVGQPAACLVACGDRRSAEQVQGVLHSARLRAYASTDLIGCEIAGATKNVLAIAAGIADGLGFGDNTRALLITRGLAEMSRLGTALGGEATTFSGLAGLGDLVATATSDKSRNRRVGVQLGEGRSLEAITHSSFMIAEGVKSAGPLRALARGVGVEMPICFEVADIVAGTTTPRAALEVLMNRPARGERDEPDEQPGWPQVSAPA
jgi:glycerol-3-phosphate dehydrogenase (NAD(P)+)